MGHLSNAQGKRKCWVLLGGLALGALGACGTTESPTQPTTPAATVSQLRFTLVVAGDDHSCGLIGDGRAYCWGGNEVGQLGMGIRNLNQPEPVAV